MKRIPEHVTIIMDGNGRWAKQRGLERIEGHKAGVEAVRASCEYAVEKGIKYLSLFAFSEENWNRPKSEVFALMGLMINAIIEETPTFHKNNIRFKVIGDISKLPEELQAKISEAERETENNMGLTLIIFLSYSGKWDIQQAAYNYGLFIRDNGLSLTEDEYANGFEKFLSTYGIPDPDLMIRTSGEQRISNFMLWQVAYSEFYFTSTLWPDFRKIDFEKALEVFSARERRFGKTGEQVNIL